MQNSSSNRPATRAEAEHAEMLLNSFGGALGRELAISLVKLSAFLEPEGSSVLVTTDFSAVGDASILLVPPGTYRIQPAHLSLQVTHVLGLSPAPENYPVLILEGEENDVIRDDDTSFPQCLFESHIRFANVVLDAPRPTVIEVMCPGGEAFSDVFFNTGWGENVDALDLWTRTFMHGRDWALETYGDTYQTRSGLEKSLDSIHQGMMNAIDNTFRPLVRMGEKLDAFLGLK